MPKFPPYAFHQTLSWHHPDPHLVFCVITTFIPLLYCRLTFPFSKYPCHPHIYPYINASVCCRSSLKQSGPLLVSCTSLTSDSGGKPWVQPWEPPSSAYLAPSLLLLQYYFLLRAAYNMINSVWRCGRNMNGKRVFFRNKRILWELQLNLFNTRFLTFLFSGEGIVSRGIWRSFPCSGSYGERKKKVLRGSHP